jgi:hypothetical protein
VGEVLLAQAIACASYLMKLGTGLVSCRNVVDSTPECMPISLSGASYTFSSLLTFCRTPFVQVSKALRLNGIGYVVVGGSRGGSGGASRDAIARFNSDPSVAVFLLTMSHGAAGLTLVSLWVLTHGRVELLMVPFGKDLPRSAEASVLCRKLAYVS